MIRENPYYFENKTYDSESGGYIKDPLRVWVSEIYKKTLTSLKVKIHRSELGGRIGHYDSSSWCFLIDKESVSIIDAHFKEVGE